MRTCRIPSPSFALFLYVVTSLTNAHVPFRCNQRRFVLVGIPKEKLHYKTSEIDSSIMSDVGLVRQRDS